MAVGEYCIAFSQPLPFVTPPAMPFAMSFGSRTAAARKKAVGCWITTRMFAPTDAPLKLLVAFTIILSRIGSKSFVPMPF